MPHLFPTNPPSKPTASTPTGVRQTATKGGPQQTHGCAFTHLGWPPDDLLSSVDMVDLLFGIGLDADRKPCARTKQRGKRQLLGCENATKTGVDTNYYSIDVAHRARIRLTHACLDKHHSTIMRSRTERSA